MPTAKFSKPLLVVEDDETVSGLLKLLLKQHGIRSHHCGRLGEARGLRTGDYALAIIDLGLPDGDGTELLQEFHKQDADFPMIVLTGRDHACDAVAALRAGARDYLTKPFDRDELLAAVKRARVRPEAPTKRPAGAPAASKAEPATLLLDYPSAAMRRLAPLIERAAHHDVPVLLTGDTGVGKGVVARTIHRLSPRRDGPLQLVTCPAIPHELAEAELFGHEKGAFTGAASARIGKIEAADGGTLFLDEIADLQIAIQPKFLEVLQSGDFTPVGGTRARHSNFRLISATNVSLRDAVAAKTFREDLYFRINLLEIRLPSLHERAEDLPLLCHSILARLPAPPGGGSWEPTSALLEWFSNYHWPGNIRQLENVLGRMILMADGPKLDVADLPLDTLEAENEPPHDIRTAILRGQALEDIEHAALVAALEQSSGNRRKAARLLGVSLRTVYNMIDRFDLPKRSGSGGEIDFGTAGG